ncbi:hypothetical protein [Paraburkholderia fungorum]|uniref:hypothetical protein n=1 Tax=Paraburkholderia fungorum TaxID=134537 RepID=UPI0038B8B432
MKVDAGLNESLSSLDSISAAPSHMDLSEQSAEMAIEVTVAAHIASKRSWLA